MVISKVPDLYKRMQFVEQNQQSKLFTFLQSKNSELYKNLNFSERTLFLRQTGDNFRASKSYPTEQFSFNIMNMSDMLNSPYGQFISNIFRGGESRLKIKLHCKEAFDELHFLIKMELHWNYLINPLKNSTL